jgi:hypothetical protein
MYKMLKTIICNLFVDIQAQQDAPTQDKDKILVFQSKLLEIISKLPKITENEILQEQTDLGTMQNSAGRLVQKSHFKSQLCDNPPDMVIMPI